MFNLSRRGVIRRSMFIFSMGTRAGIRLRKATPDKQGACPYSNDSCEGNRPFLMFGITI